MTPTIDSNSRAPAKRASEIVAHEADAMMRLVEKAEDLVQNGGFYIKKGKSFSPIAVDPAALVDAQDKSIIRYAKGVQIALQMFINEQIYRINDDLGGHPKSAHMSIEERRDALDGFKRVTSDFFLGVGDLKDREGDLVSAEAYRSAAQKLAVTNDKALSPSGTVDVLQRVVMKEMAFYNKLPNIEKWPHFTQSTEQIEAQFRDVKKLTSLHEGPDLPSNSRENAQLFNDKLGF